MVRSPKPPSPRQPANLTVQQMRAGIERLKKRVDDVRSFDPKSVIDQSDTPGLDALAASVDDALTRTFGADTLEYRRYIDAKDFDCGPYNYSYQVPPREFQASIARSISSSVALLESAIGSLEEQLEEHANYQVELHAEPKSMVSSNKVFVVHGHDDAAKEGLARFLEKIELQAVVLHEQPNQGRTIIEKFEEYAGQVGFAVVLMTPDDFGAANGAATQNGRARQNVIFELGYFAGKLGRGKTCLLRKGDVEIPSDLYGVIYTDLDSNDGWKVKLVKEMKAAGLAFDANKLWE